MSELIHPPSIPSHHFLPCESLQWSLADLEPHIPKERLLRTAQHGEVIDLPCSHVFAHIVPLLSLQLLSTLRPDFVETSSDLIRLPVQFLTSSYPLEEITVHDEDEPFLPSIETCLHSPIANIQNIEKATSTAAALNQPTEKTVDNLSERTDPLTPPEPPRDEKSAISPDSIPRKLAEILPNLPTFRRVEEFPLSASSSKPLTTVAHSSPAHLPDYTQEAIQSLFLTEEPIDLPKVAALCGSLPGIESCVLAHQDRVLCSHNAPDCMDLVSLSSNASTMLRSMQNASDKMGIGDIPAVTLHTPRGPLSILQQERLTLIVLHGKRGFIPGVREKMTATLLELNRSQLQLPASSESSSQPHAQP